jgi:hypothetical protein
LTKPPKGSRGLVGGPVSPEFLIEVLDVVRKLA